MRGRIIALATFFGLLMSPFVIAHDTGANPGYYYPPYPYYGGSNSDFFEDGSMYGDSRGRGAGRGSGAGVFNMSISGKGSGEQIREGDFGTSGYGGTNSYPYRYPYRAPYGYGAPANTAPQQR